MSSDRVSTTEKSAKPAQKKYHLAHYAKHRERILAGLAAKKAAETPEQAEARRQHYKDNYKKYRERYLSYQKEKRASMSSEAIAEKRSSMSSEERELYLATARNNAKRLYWSDPEAARAKSQAFKHARPDYRAKWNAKRGKLEEKLSDGTLTIEVVQGLFAASSKCPYCGDPYEKSRRSLDHIVPLAKAGDRKLHSITNVLVCCFICNNKKRTKGLTQFLEEVKSAKRKNASGSTPKGIPSLFECLAN